MNYNVVIPPEIDERIVEISNYIYSVTCSSKIATKVYSEIYGSIKKLNFLPHIYQEFFGWFRVINVLNYRIFYKINETKSEVRIHYIFWASQDFSKIIK